MGAGGNNLASLVNDPRQKSRTVGSYNNHNSGEPTTSKVPNKLPETPRSNPHHSSDLLSPVTSMKAMTIDTSNLLTLNSAKYFSPKSNVASTGSSSQTSFVSSISPVLYNQQNSPMFPYVNVKKFYILCFYYFRLPVFCSHNLCLLLFHFLQTFQCHRHL